MMPIVTSSRWNEETGICEKHLTPEVPCRSCLAEQDPEIEVRLTEMDRVTMDLDPSLAFEDLLPGEHSSWLRERLVE